MKNPLLFVLALLCFRAAPSLAQKTSFKLIDVTMYNNGSKMYGGTRSAAGQTVIIDKKVKELWLMSGVPSIQNRLFQIIAVKQKPDTTKYVCKPITDGSPDTVFITAVPANKLIKLNGKKIKYPESSKFWAEYHYE